MSFIILFFIFVHQSLLSMVYKKAHIILCSLTVIILFIKIKEMFIDAFHLKCDYT